MLSSEIRNNVRLEGGKDRKKTTLNQLSFLPGELSSFLRERMQRTTPFEMSEMMRLLDWKSLESKEGNLNILEGLYSWKGCIKKNKGYVPVTHNFRLMLSLLKGLAVWHPIEKVHKAVARFIMEPLECGHIYIPPSPPGYPPVSRPQYPWAAFTYFFMEWTNLNDPPNMGIDLDPETEDEVEGELEPPSKVAKAASSSYSAF